MRGDVQHVGEDEMARGGLGASNMCASILKIDMGRCLKLHPNTRLGTVQRSGHFMQDHSSVWQDAPILVEINPAAQILLAQAM